MRDSKLLKKELPEIMCRKILLLFLLGTAVIYGQDLIGQLSVFDQINAADWSIQINLQPGDLMFGDREYLITDVPQKYRGMEWIRTANDSKGYSGDTLVTFTVNDSVDVYIAYDDRLSQRDWLTGWSDNGEDLVNSETQPKTFSLFTKKFAPEERVILGSVNQTSGANNYIIIVGISGGSIQYPDPFEFYAKFDVPLNSLVESDPVEITGLSKPAPISISGGEYSVNNSGFMSTPGTINNNDGVKIRLQMANEFGSVSTTNITIGAITTDFSARTEDDPNMGWHHADLILTEIDPTVFPDKDFLITDYGAIGDGTTDCTEAFRLAITACSDSGGGRVVVPADTFLTGAIRLRSNINLYVSKNAVIKFSQNPADYLPVVYTRFEGTECYNYSPPIYAFEEENIAITGSGTIDGGGDAEHWWPWTSSGSADVSTLRQMAEDGVPVDERIFGEGHFLRPNMIQPYRCNRVLIDSVTILNSPMWHIHPVLSQNIIVTNVQVVGHGPNNDGCNPESCSKVLIRNCYFDTGDDCIAIKSGRNADGRRIDTPSQNIIIQDCTMKDGHGGVVIGSEISGGANNIFAEECSMNSPNLDRALRIKTNSIRGGLIENIFLRNITVGQVSDAAIRVNFYYGEGDISTYDPIVRNVEVRNLTCETTGYALRLEGYSRSPIEDLRLINCTFTNVQRSNLLSGIKNLSLNNVDIEGEIYKTIIAPSNDNPVNIDFFSDDVYGESLILYPNFPNPFNGTTFIRFYLAQKQIVHLDVYNILGQKVMGTFKTIQNPGTNLIQLNTDNLASGNYLYRLSTKGAIRIGRFLLLK